LLFQGGVGKTMLTGAVVRDERVRGAFERIAWIGMSQQPELLQLQAKLYQQLHPQNEEMPSKAISLDASLRELTSLVSKRVVLVCLDDVWDSSHEASFACIDIDTASRQLVTTRIKGLLQGAAEVELELLGLQESVELLAGVACLNGAEISPACLEIAQLCGRLPLCLSIVGNLIRTFGSGWEIEIPATLRTDMRSLTEAAGGGSKDHTPLNLQQRVIQSGVCSDGDSWVVSDLVLLLLCRLGFYFGCRCGMCGIFVQSDGSGRWSFHIYIQSLPAIHFSHVGGNILCSSQKTKSFL